MASTIITSITTGGTNSHATSAQEVNATRTDFGAPGVVGTITANTGSGGTGSFCVNADASPDMGVTIKAGSAYITATPSGQLSQLLRAYMASDYATYTISANSSGSTKYDWIYLSVDATKANNPASDASDVTSLVTSRSSSNTTDNGSPPTYGLLLAIVTVANGASSITNSNITDKRVNASWSTVQTDTYFFDFVESGCVWSGDSYGSTLNASMTAGVVWIAGKRLTVKAVSARAFTASKDTYVDLSDNGDGTAAFTYTTATNNAASPALAANSVRIAIIVTGASSIAAAGSVNQGQETMVLPIASSVPYAVTDSLGNLICPRDPQRKILGYRQITTDFTTTATPTITNITGISVPFIAPGNRKVKVSLVLPVFYTTATSGTVIRSYVRESTTQLADTYANVSSSYSSPTIATGITTPSAGLHTYTGDMSQSAAGTLHADGSTSTAVFLMVELV